jgi:hypothetical protein
MRQPANRWLLVLWSVVFSVIVLFVAHRPTCVAVEPAAMPDWLAEFQDPPATWRPQIFFVTNGQLNRERTTEMLRQYKERGIGGVFFHCRPGLITEYLSDEYFAQWEWALTECKRLEMECHIYDENAFPSGFASGEVLAADPSLGAKYLAPVKITRPAQAPDNGVVAYFTGLDAGEPKRVDRSAVQDASQQNPVWAVVLTGVSADLRHGGFPYPDLLRRETAEIFLRTTHDKYAERFAADFGGAIKYVFTDEPRLPGKQGIPFSDQLAEAFQEDHGYDLRDKLESLMFEQPDSKAVRFDYFFTVNRLWTDNFMRPIYEWCGRHNLLFTGHHWEHGWPSLNDHPQVMSSLRWMQAPGTDLLGFHFKPTTFQDQSRGFANQMELSSIGHQLGCPRLLCESCGAGGYEMALRDFKPLEDLLMATGVNLMVPHLSYQTLAGARKYDWAQTMSDHSAWWDGYGLQANHVGRVLYTLAQGKPQGRVLMLNMDSTPWIYYRHEKFVPEDKDASDALDRIQSAQIGMISELHRAGIDFDLGDEFTMAELGKLTDDCRLRIGEAVYETIIIPPAMDNWTSATLVRIAEYLAAGGTIYAAGEPAAYVDGRASKQPMELAAKFANRWKQYQNTSEAVAAVRAAFPPRITAADGGPLPENLLYRRHTRPDGTVIFFFANPWETPLVTDLRLEGRQLIGLDTVNGTATRVPTAAHPSGQVTQLDLPPFGHALLVSLPQSGPAVDMPAEPQWQPVDLTPREIVREQPNMLVIPFCDWKSGDTQARGINTTLADNMNWKQHGCEKNIWSFTAQFRRSFIDMPFPADSGFTVDYHFEIAPDAFAAVHDSLEIAIERPWLYRVTLNDRELRFARREQWFDEDIRKTSIATGVQPGTNTLRLTARPMHPLCEIMPVYVLGEFALEPAPAGFTIVKPQPLHLGSWLEQGMPFYADKVAYRYTFALDRPKNQIAVALPDWGGTLGQLCIDGRPMGLFAWPPDRIELDTLLSAGHHKLEIIVAGNPRNQMGPHFSEGLPIVYSWIYGARTVQPGEKYMLRPAGLYEQPEVEVSQ